MLTIRNAQMEAIRRDRREDFLLRACRAVSHALAAVERPLDPAALRHRVLAGIKRAAAFHIEREQDIVDYLLTSFLFRDGFQYESPTIQEIAFLSTGGLPVDRIARYRAWAHASRDTHK